MSLVVWPLPTISRVERHIECEYEFRNYQCRLEQNQTTKVSFAFPHQSGDLGYNLLSSNACPRTVPEGMERLSVVLGEFPIA